MPRGASLEELFPPFAWFRQASPNQARGVERVWSLYRDFGDDVVGPASLALDDADGASLELQQRELLAQACRRNLFGATLPVAYGGLGLPVLGLLPALEELAYHCAGIANLLSVHGLGLAVVGATGNLRVLGELCERLVASERDEDPELIATAATEPGVGTDLEDVELLGTAKLASEATPVDGGYLLNGRKVFISNGSLARHVIVLMPTQRAAPAATLKAFWVRSHNPGFSVERVESKMGQRACPAAMLAFDDCFVPERDCIAPIGGRELDLILGATRGAVAAYGAGIARSALERASNWACCTRDRHGSTYLDAQWVKLRLADAQECVLQARAAYWAAAAANDGYGLSSLMTGSRQQAQHWLPKAFVDTRVTRAVLASRVAGSAARAAVSNLPEWSVSLAAAWGAASKVTASNQAIRACELALEITGSAGLRREFGLEKLLRDARLLQIYEGTNELNRLELFAKTMGGSVLSSPRSSPATRATVAAVERPHAQGPEDAELDELDSTVRRWLTSRAEPAETRARHRPCLEVPADTLAELVELGAPQMGAPILRSGPGATPKQLARVLVAFGRLAPQLGGVLLAHWLGATCAAAPIADRGNDAWRAFPLYEDPCAPSAPLLAERGSARLRGRATLVVGASHAEYLVLPVLFDGSRAPEWHHIPRSLAGVRVSAPIQTHGLAGTGTCDVEVDVAPAQWKEAFERATGEPPFDARSASRQAMAYAVALCLGILESSTEATTEYVTLRRQGGRALLDHDAIAEMVANLSADLTTVTGVLEALLAESTNEPVRLGLLLSARAATLRGTDTGIRALGGYGYLTPYLQAERHRDARQACAIFGRTALLRLRLRDLLRDRA